MNPEIAIKRTLDLLNNSSNDYWIEDFSRYINNIQKNQKKNSKLFFHQPKCLSLYSTVSSTGYNFDLRFNGQSVGMIIQNRNNEVNLQPKTDTNISYFGAYGYDDKVKIKGKSVSWKSKEAMNFRKFFENLYDTEKLNVKLRSPEHVIENVFLKEFSKRTRAEDKAFINIQPVKLYNRFFQMPTSISASDHSEIKMAKTGKGGGIDILSRVKYGPLNSRLCIMEVKDQNIDSESQYDTMSQAIAYAVFLSKLLRSKSGYDWWNFFMNHRDKTTYTDVPQELHLDVVTIMEEGTTKSFDNKTLYSSELATYFHCHTIYFKVGENDKLTLSGSYLNQVPQ